MKNICLTIAVFSFIFFFSCKNKVEGQTKSSIEKKEKSSNSIESTGKEIKIENRREKEKKQPLESVEISALKNGTKAENKLEKTTQLTELETNNFEGIKVGDTFMDHSDKFKRTDQKNDASTFKGYQIMNHNAKVIGFAFANLNDKSKIGAIEITSENYKTKEGIGIGNNFEELKNAYSNIKLAQNKNSVTVINYKFIFDNNNMNASSKIKKIMITK